MSIEAFESLAVQPPLVTQHHDTNYLKGLAWSASAVALGASGIPLIAACFSVTLACGWATLDALSNMDLFDSFVYGLPSAAGVCISIKLFSAFTRGIGTCLNNASYNFNLTNHE